MNKFFLLLIFIILLTSFSFAEGERVTDGAIISPKDNPVAIYNITDGNLSTIWFSLVTSTVDNNQWIIFDLGQEKDFSRIDLKDTAGQDGLLWSYLVQGSNDNSSWVTISDNRSPMVNFDTNGTLWSGSSVKYRYINFTLTNSSNPSGRGMEIYEFTAYNITTSFPPSTPNGSTLNSANQTGQTLTLTGAGSIGADNYLCEFRCDNATGDILQANSTNCSWVINSCNNNELVNVLTWGNNSFGTSATYELLTRAINSTNFTITAQNIWNGSSINNFNATINGTKYESIAGIVTIENVNNTIGLQDILIQSEDYFSKTYSNYNTNNSLVAELGQTISAVRLFTKFGGEQINSFTLETDAGTFTTTNGSIIIEPNLNEVYLWNVTSSQYFNRTNEQFNTSSTINNFVVEDMFNARIRFIDNETSNPFIGSDIRLTYPSGLLFTTPTNATGWVELAGEIDGDNSIFNATFLAFAGYLTPVTFPYNISSATTDTNSIDQTTIIINLLDYETEQPILQNVTINIVNYFQVSTTTGNITIQNVSISAGTIGVYADSDNYTTTQVSFVYTSQEEVELTMYLKNENISNLGTLFVNTLNEDYYGIKGADVRLTKYFPIDADYKEVEQCFSDSNGECVFNIILEDERYIITSTKIIDGVTLFDQSSLTGDFYKVDNTVIELYLRSEELFILPDDFDLIIIPSNTTLVNNVSFLNAFFVDPNGADHTVCISYEFLDGITTTVAQEKCVSSSSGTVDITGGYLLNRNFTWTAKIYTEDSSGDFKKLYYTYTYPSDTSFSSIFILYLPIIIIVLMAIAIGLSIMLSNILIFPISMIGILILAKIIDNTSFSGLSISVMIFVCIILIYLARKPNDNEGT